MDKASALVGDAIEYLEYLQQRVKTLEELQAANMSAEEDEGSSASTDELRLPEIETRVRGNNILLKIQCAKRKGLLGKILGQVDKLDLAVVNIGVAPFGTWALDITIVVKMEREFRRSTKDIVAAIRSALQEAEAGDGAAEDEET